MTWMTRKKKLRKMNEMEISAVERKIMTLHHDKNGGEKAIKL